MPQPRRTAAKQKQETPPEQPANGNAEHPHDELWATRRQRADEIWQDGETLTAAGLRKLMPLLSEPTPPRFIETIGDVPGKPYTSTGIRSSQVQVDHMNQVLSPTHWRFLPHYSPDGQLCRTHVIVGNQLQWARLDDKGELMPYTVMPDCTLHAEVLAHVQGMGGHARGSGKADIWKGSETNALKRTLARIGPGCEVYRLDFEDDPRQPANRAASRSAQQPAPAAERDEPAQEPGQVLADLLAGRDGADEEVQKLRVEADKLLAAFTEHAEHRLRRIQPCGKDKRKLRDLIDRANATLDAQLSIGEEPQ